MGAHQLAADWMFRRVDMQKVTGSFSRLQIDQEFIQHDLANRVRSSMPLGDNPHRPVAVAGKRSLNDGKIDRDIPDPKWLQFTCLLSGFQHIWGFLRATAMFLNDIMSTNLMGMPAGKS